MDVQQHRIPNWLTYPAILMGVLLRAHLWGLNGVFTALGGGLLSAGIVFVFYAVRAMGGGDLKLMAAIGAVSGPRYALVSLLATAIAGGVLAIIYAVYRSKLLATLGNTGELVKFHVAGGMQVHPDLNLDNPDALRMPYGLAIAAGSLYTFIAACWR